MTNLKAEIGVRIAQTRKQHGDTQADAAEKLGIKRGTLATYELGTSAMPDEIKSKFVKIYNISYDYLMFGKSSEIIHEPEEGYKKTDLISLLNQFQDDELHKEIKSRVMALIQHNTELQDKIIKLLEEKEQLLTKNKK